MARVNNFDTKTETPLPELQKALASLKPGETVKCPSSKLEILKIQENITKRRHEIPGADSHLEYIEAMIIAEAEGKLEFRK